MKKWWRHTETFPQKLTVYHYSVFVMPGIVEKDISIVRLGHVVPEL